MWVTNYRKIKSDSGYLWANIRELQTLQLRHRIAPFYCGYSPGETQRLRCCLKRHIHCHLNGAIFTVWRHTWRKKWVNWAVLIAQASELSFPVVFHTQNCAVHSGNPTVSSFYLPTPRWHHLKADPFLTIHSADEHHMIYSFPNTTYYATFYTFFSSFRITLWSMRLANSKGQPCSYPP